MRSSWSRARQGNVLRLSLSLFLFRDSASFSVMFTIVKFFVDDNPVIHTRWFKFSSILFQGTMTAIVV